MTHSEFRKAVHAGLGRSILYARSNDLTEFRDLILDACLHCYSVDKQSEGTRADYMYELVSLLPDTEFYCEQVLNELPDCGDDWDAVQCFRFATWMAFDGDEQARKAIYDNFNPGPSTGENIAINLVQMDGIEGFLYGASKIGALLMARREEVDTGQLWCATTEMLGLEVDTAALDQAAGRDPALGVYRKEALAPEETSRFNDITGLR